MDNSLQPRPNHGRNLFSLLAHFVKQAVTSPFSRVIIRQVPNQKNLSEDQEVQVDVDNPELPDEQQPQPRLGALIVTEVREVNGMLEDVIKWDDNALTMEDDIADALVKDSDFRDLVGRHRPDRLTSSNRIDKPTKARQ